MSAAVLLAALVLATPAATGGMTPSMGGHVTTGDPRNAAVMPEQRIGIRFDHRLHLGDVGLKCNDCHGSVVESTKTTDFHLPLPDTCLECHDASEIPWRWGPGIKPKQAALDMPPAHLRFSHADHLRRAGVTCLTCHEGVPTTQLATRENLPSMETCLSCHDGKQAPNDCKTCHVGGRGGTIRTTFDSGVLKPDDHGAHWLKEHSVAAQRDLGYCASCHAQSDCLACHDGSIPPTFHDANYLILHPQEGMANNPPCASCHRIDRFCRDCHFRAQVTFGGPLEPTFEGNFHPGGWNFPGDPNHHSNVARKNLAACTGCHVKDDCLTCHVFYEGAPPTHPPGWAHSVEMRRLRSVNFSLCLQCHGMGQSGDPIPPP